MISTEILKSDMLIPAETVIISMIIFMLLGFLIGFTIGTITSGKGDEQS